VAQTLATALRYLQILEAMTPQELAGGRELLERACKLVRQAIQEVREVIYSLQPATLGRLGLTAALRQELQRLREETGWQVEFAAEELVLSKEEELALYRIIHEAVTNARKHSQTQRLRVALWREKGRVIAEVTDWGRGFNVDEAGGGRGLVTMQRRAELLGGRCHIQSQPGQGVRVRVELPQEGRP